MPKVVSERAIAAFVGVLVMTCAVYKIINRVNGRCYVGASVNLDRRWKEHRKNIANPPTHRDRLGRLCRNPKRLLEDCLELGLGLDDFTFLILEFCDPEILFEREDFWMKRFEPIYNSKTYENGVWVHKGFRDRKSA